MAEPEDAEVRGARELRFVPRRRRRRGAGILLLPAFASLLAGGGWMHARLTDAPLWAVRSIAVSGNRSIQRDDLLDRLGLAPGMPWWSVQSRAGALVAAEPRLEAVEVDWQWPRDLRVRVRERQGFLRVLASPPLEVATDGVLFASNDELDPIDLPLLTGALPTGLAPGQTLRLGPAGGEWKEFLDLQRRSPAVWKRISEIEYAGGRDFRLYLRDGHRVVLWETGINDPLKRTLTEVLADLEGSDRHDVVVDLRFRDQIVLRLPEGVASKGADRIAAPTAAIPALTVPPGRGRLTRGSMKPGSSAGAPPGRRRA